MAFTDSKQKVGVFDVTSGIVLLCLELGWGTELVPVEYKESLHLIDKTNCSDTFFPLLRGRTLNLSVANTPVKKILDNLGIWPIWLSTDQLGIWSVKLSLQ